MNDFACQNNLLQQFYYVFSPVYVDVIFEIAMLLFPGVTNLTQLSVLSGLMCDTSAGENVQWEVWLNLLRGNALYILFVLKIYVSQHDVCWTTHPEVQTFMSYTLSYIMYFCIIMRNTQEVCV